MSEPARRIEYMLLDELVPARRNPKRHRHDLLVDSIVRFGVTSPALLDERTERLVVGHGRTEALTQMRDSGAQAPEGVRVDEAGRWSVPVVRGWASADDAEADAYLLADNRHSELGGWDDASLAEMLTELAGQDFDLAELAGWQTADLEELLAAAEEQTAAAPIIEHSTVPATGADYAETPEQLAERNERIAAYEPRLGPAGFAEMILVYSEPDRAEAVRLVAAARARLGGDLRASEVMLRGLRLLVAALEADGATPLSEAMAATVRGEPIAA